MGELELPRHHTIRESSHRVLNPFTPAKLATLGAALRLAPGAEILDLACGKGELLCTWARDYGTRGVGVDISTVFLDAARARAVELGVEGSVRFVHADAGSFVAPAPVDVAACIGATWVGGGFDGTVTLLRRSVRPGGLLLLGEPFWRKEPDSAAVEACTALGADEFRTLAGIVTAVGDLGYDLVEMVLADEDSWDRYRAAQWLNLRRWLDANPDDPLAPTLRDELRTAPLQHVRHEREYLGWGVFALMER